MAPERLDLEEGLEVLRIQQSAYSVAPWTKEKWIPKGRGAVTLLDLQTSMRCLNLNYHGEQPQKGRRLWVRS